MAPGAVSIRASCPTRFMRWKPFKETNSVLAKTAKAQKIGLISNIDDKLLGQTRRHIPLDFDLVVTAQQVQVLQARSGALHRMRAADRHQEGLGPRRRPATTTTSSLA